jgi:hypothetical protein
LEQRCDQSIDMHTDNRSPTTVIQTCLEWYCSLIHGQAIDRRDAGRPQRAPHHRQ